jgi:hypothetical protein
MVFIQHEWFTIRELVLKAGALLAEDMHMYAVAVLA